MMRVREVLRVIVWLLPPSRTKNLVLRTLGHKIHRTARAGIALVWRTSEIEMAAGAKTGNFVVIKSVKRLHLAKNSSLGGWNLISANPVFALLYPRGAEVLLGDEAAITTRHTLDCSGGIYLGAFALMAGHGSEVLTHSISLTLNAQAAYSVVIGQRCFVGTRCIILGGVDLPDRSVLAAGSTLLPAPPGQRRTGRTLYAGVPARPKGEISGAWFDRTQESTRDVYLPEERRIQKDAF